MPMPTSIPSSFPSQDQLQKLSVAAYHRYVENATSRLFPSGNAFRDKKFTPSNYAVDLHYRRLWSASAREMSAADPFFFLCAPRHDIMENIRSRTHEDGSAPVSGGPVETGFGLESEAFHHLQSGVRVPAEWGRQPSSRSSWIGAKAWHAGSAF